MWYAPSAADWQKPVQVRWQRSWEDAVALAQQTKRAILVCVNMDGEIASEHYAGVRYRDPEIAKLYEPYVCVIASVFRHNPRDYDDQGQRIPCPRFGGCTCGEHMALEPVVFEKFLGGQRVAPRHIMVELDGSKAFDVFYAFDTASVFQTLGDGIKNRAVQAQPVVKGDRSILEKVQSPDSQDRDEVERTYGTGDAEQRRALLAAALTLGEKAPLEVLRQALYGLDAAQSRRARDGLAAAAAPGTADLIGEALRGPVDAAERERLVAALERLAASSPRAQALAVVHRGLTSNSTTIDTERWAQALSGAASYAPAAETLDVAQRLDARDRALLANPTNPTARIEQAEASLAQAQLETTQARFRQLLLQDARQQAEQAQQLGGPAWRSDTVLALTAQQLGETAVAYAAAERAAASLPPDATSPVTAAVLFLFAEARQEAIVAAHKQKRKWPQAWLTDVHATYEVLAKHPHGTDTQVGHHYDFLKFFGGTDAANRALDSGLERFPESAALHERLRNRLLQETDVETLVGTYEALLARHASPTLRWFAGYAFLVGAEHHRRRGRSEPALANYALGITAFERTASEAPTMAESCHHYIAIARFGESRVHFESDDLDGAVRAVIAGFERHPAATPVLDGLNLSGADTARMLVAKLGQGNRPELLAKLQAGMAALDPDLLRLPDYERQGPGGTPPPRRRRG